MSGERESAAALELLAAAVAAGRLSADSAGHIQRWLTQPAFRRYVPRLAELIHSGQFETLERLFWQVIPFGTGGRRGEMAELGSATINARTIAESAHGLAVYLKSRKPAGEARAVIAYDTRHRSAEFARLTATTLAAHRLKVYFFESPRSTPELSFAVRHLSCDVGAMITASHNPPSDNGFKAYWSHGGQVLPPHDRGIIDCVYQAGEIPEIEFDAAVAEGRIELIGEQVDREYIAAVLRLSLSRARDVPAVYTPLHGVGETSVWRTLTEAGFWGIELFEPHRAADGNFTNVPDQLPNPERPEVFRPVIPRAREIGAELILASDPDADRLGVMARDAAGEFGYLTGNQVGALLADYALGKRKAAGTLSPQHYVVETLVTTPLIAAIGRSYGVRVFDELLVGFKYIAETMEREGADRLVFAAEESIGFLAGAHCRDKDASVAALYVMELAAELRAQRKTLWDRLDELYVAHGYFQEGQVSKYCHGPQGKAQIDLLMRQFRTAPPVELAGLPLVRVRDYGRHEIRELPANRKAADLPQPRGDLVIFETSPGGGCAITFAVRPSGTEPKIKFYFFARGPVCGAEALPAVKTATGRTLGQAQAALLSWIETALAGSGQ